MLSNNVFILVQMVRHMQVYSQSDVYTLVLISFADNCYIELMPMLFCVCSLCQSLMIRSVPPVSGIYADQILLRMGRMQVCSFGSFPLSVLVAGFCLLLAEGLFLSLPFRPISSPSHSSRSGAACSHTHFQ